MTAEEAKQALKEGKKVRVMLNEGVGEIELQSRGKAADIILETYKDDDWEIVE